MSGIANLVFGSLRVAQSAAPRMAPQRALFSHRPTCPASEEATISLKDRAKSFGILIAALRQSGRTLDLQKNPITEDVWSQEELQTVLKVIDYKGPPPEMRLPKGEDLKDQKQWAQDLLKLLHEHKNPVANYHFSTNDIKTKRQASDTIRIFHGNNVEGLKCLAKDLKQGKKFEGTICLDIINLETPEIREALAQIITLPCIKYQHIDQDFVPIGLSDKDYESDPSLEGLLS